MDTSDRLRQWAEMLDEHGPELTPWGMRPLVVAELRRMAAEFERLTQIAIAAEPGI